MARILIAEDDRSMGEFLGKALERAGHTVTVTFDGVEAQKSLQENDYDLLLADIVMPGMDGIELSRHAAEKKPDIKVMFITGFTAVATAASTAAPQNARLLSKPFHLNDLVAQVEALLNGT